MIFLNFFEYQTNFKRIFPKKCEIFAENDHFLDFLVFDHHYHYHDNHRLCNAKKCERCENVKNRFLSFFNFETQD